MIVKQAKEKIITILMNEDNYIKTAYKMQNNKL